MILILLLFSVFDVALVLAACKVAGSYDCWEDFQPIAGNYDRWEDKTL